MSASWREGGECCIYTDERLFEEHRMNIAFKRIHQCDGILDLTDLGFTTLPPLPENLVELRVDRNHLTSLPSLPPSLKVLICSRNRLTSLPPLPPSLRVLSCQANRITSLPELPSTLQVLRCTFNHLTSLPPLPTTLRILDCVANRIQWLPWLPDHLRVLYCNENPLEALPELPRDLGYLMCDMPYGEQVELVDTTPEEIHRINTEMWKWTEKMEQQSKARCMARCAIYKEQIMMKVWHPTRIEKMLEMGYDVEDM